MLVIDATTKFPSLPNYPQNLIAPQCPTQHLQPARTPPPVPASSSSPSTKNPSSTICTRCYRLQSYHSASIKAQKCLTYLSTNRPTAIIITHQRTTNTQHSAV